MEILLDFGRVAIDFFVDGFLDLGGGYGEAWIFTDLGYRFSNGDFCWFVAVF